MGLLDWLLGRQTPPKTATSARLTFSKPRAAPAGRYGTQRYMPPGEWVKATTLLKVAGITHRMEAANEFALAISEAPGAGKRHGIRLEPEPTNQHDPNAIKVYGTVGSAEWHVGYVDSDTAKDIKGDLIDAGQPIAGELYEVWVGDTGFIDIKFLILAPPGNSEKARRNRRRAAR